MKKKNTQKQQSTWLSSMKTWGSYMRWVHVDLDWILAYQSEGKWNVNESSASQRATWEQMDIIFLKKLKLSYCNGKSSACTILRIYKQHLLLAILQSPHPYLHLPGFPWVTNFQGFCVCPVGALYCLPYISVKLTLIAVYRSVGVLFEWSPFPCTGLGKRWTYWTGCLSVLADPCRP